MEEQIKLEISQKEAEELGALNSFQKTAILTREFKGGLFVCC